MRSKALLLLFPLLAACGASGPAQYQGYVEAEYVDVASSQAGRLSRLAVRRGDEIAAGTALFALEATPQAAALQQAEQELAAAQAQHEDLQSGKRLPEQQVVEAQLAQAEAAAQQSGAQLRRDEQQFAVHAIAQAQLEASRATADADTARVRELRKQLEVARLPGRAQQLAALAAQVDAAQAAVAQARWRLDEMAQNAPQAGRVEDTLYRDGEWIAAGSPVVRLLPPDRVKIRFFVPETKLGALQPGQKVRIHCDGCAADVEATIRFIAAQAEYTPPVIYSNETRAKLVFMIEAWPAADDARVMHPGQPVAVTPL